MPLIAGFGVLIHTKSRRTLIVVLVEACVQVRAESPMERSAQGKRSDALGITCWGSRALKGQKH